MPARARRLNSGATVIEHFCENCKAPAYFGIGVSLRAALNAADKGKVALAKELLGKWYCLTCWRKLNEKNDKNSDSRT